MAATRPRLYVLPGSHPCAAVEEAMKLESIDYDRVDLSIGDVRPLIEGRPSARLARYFPQLSSEIPPGVLPAEWLAAAAHA
jgi:hypothetical protein